MPKPKPGRANIVRERWAAWLSSRLRSSAISIAHLDEAIARRTGRSGDARRIVRGWLSGEITVTAHYAFVTGEALADCGELSSSGPIAILAAGYGTEFLSFLDALSKLPNPTGKDSWKIGSGAYRALHLYCTAWSAVYDETALPESLDGSLRASLMADVQRVRDALYGEKHPGVRKLYADAWESARPPRDPLVKAAAAVIEASLFTSLTGLCSAWLALQPWAERLDARFVRLQPYLTPLYRAEAAKLPLPLPAHFRHSKETRRDL